ncbi:hypothetical protein AGMMS50256_37530 [Betaproteobacteria bacterium]|nr:hypothetical protein AGMMS50256_37530 [Betaproteobacteria bacterium]
MILYLKWDKLRRQDFLPDAPPDLSISQDNDNLPENLMALE